ncbi:hypothetical protein CTAYLR_005134 [Chrysophaeum taylorii]|uniref:Complex 1 LYR protein domain-containing protein n=1 Tax=Chrysophaeum taylorii TaxID=2483200 RepID=A0AAD7UET1_9STRA|nr:hypothetical protein CTAYLR_005134 [Chrysophaeum taylorii]
MALRVYRSLLRVSRTMAPPQREAVRVQARSELDFFRDVTDEREIARLVNVFEDKVSFARMTTTTRSTVQQSGRTRIVYKDGQKVDVGTPREKAKWSNWRGDNLDPDSGWIS